MEELLNNLGEILPWEHFILAWEILLPWPPTLCPSSTEVPIPLLTLTREISNRQKPAILNTAAGRERRPLFQIFLLKKKKKKKISKW